MLECLFVIDQRVYYGLCAGDPLKQITLLQSLASKRKANNFDCNIHKEEVELGKRNALWKDRNTLPLVSDSNYLQQCICASVAV